MPKEIAFLLRRGPVIFQVDFNCVAIFRLGKRPLISGGRRWLDLVKLAVKISVPHASLNRRPCQPIRPALHVHGSIGLGLACNLVKHPTAQLTAIRREPPCVDNNSSSSSSTSTSTSTSNCDNSCCNHHHSHHC